ncbi:MAG: Asp-tRNA(Asn)/Glu-tRNA(Gln) amidotransferase subunit GatC [Alphaproteobacteria bacterium]|nr:Asp-tRNA(Asn)/Glu-tRNA(Gln) amidotransferase subunit GatC [Alphaproteobacteria bacterium]MCL2504939.1 Asp-tRNA(Asn)/Glu-tRNA(Gln) amidotransferase subunit GatC [Alphaproteobacteria bacterium]
MQNNSNPITKETVANIANLARIKVTDEEKPAMADELNVILNWVVQLDEVNTVGIEPLVNVNDEDYGSLRSRPDIVNDGNIQTQILANAPSAAMGFFTVPKVIE